MANLAPMLESSLPYLVLTLYQLSLAVHLALQQAVILDGVNAMVFAVYQQIFAALVLCGLAIFFERGKRPPLSFYFLSWAFLIGFLQITGGQVLIIVSLRYVSIIITTVATNMIPTVIFVLTIFTGQEAFKPWSLIGQVKLLSIVSSAAGATMLFFFSNPGAIHEDSVAKDGWWFGCILVGTFILMLSMAAICLEKVAVKYKADLTLSATITAFGTIQTLVVALLMERDPSSWKIKLFSLQFLIILYGGIFIAGLGYLSMTWCVRIRGPVFANAFSPLLIVFSFFLQTILFGRGASTWRLFCSNIASALLVICSLYLLLWAKSKEIAKIDGKDSYETSNIEPLLLNTTS